MFFGAEAFDTFLWSGTIGTLILLVVYVLATIGAIRLVFVSAGCRVPMWQIVIPIAALVVLGYTLYRNVVPVPGRATTALVPGRRVGWLAAGTSHASSLSRPAGRATGGAALTAAASWARRREEAGAR